MAKFWPKMEKIRSKSGENLKFLLKFCPKNGENFKILTKFGQKSMNKLSKELRNAGLQTPFPLVTKSNV